MKQVQQRAGERSCLGNSGGRFPVPVSLLRATWQPRWRSLSGVSLLLWLTVTGLTGTADSIAWDVRLSLADAAAGGYQRIMDWSVGKDLKNDPQLRSQWLERWRLFVPQHPETHEAAQAEFHLLNDIVERSAWEELAPAAQAWFGRYPNSATLHSRLLATLGRTLLNTNVPLATRRANFDLYSNHLRGHGQQIFASRNYLLGLDQPAAEALLERAIALAPASRDAARAGWFLAFLRGEIDFVRPPLPRAIVPAAEVPATWPDWPAVSIAPASDGLMVVTPTSIAPRPSDTSENLVAAQRPLARLAPGTVTNLTDGNSDSAWVPTQVPAVIVVPLARRATVRQVIVTTVGQCYYVVSLLDAHGKRLAQAEHDRWGADDLRFVALSVTGRAAVATAVRFADRHERWSTWQPVTESGSNVAVPHWAV